MSVWDVERIWQLAEDLIEEEIDIDSIKGPDEVTWFSKEGGEPTVRNVAMHAKRIMECDLTYPPILTEDYCVFDGMHRIARHILDGRKTIKVKRFARNPKPDIFEAKALETD
jgi:hypothetical protein